MTKCIRTKGAQPIAHMYFVEMYIDIVLVHLCVFLADVSHECTVKEEGE